MNSIKIDSLKSKETWQRDYSYLINILKKMGADVTEEEIVLPNIPQIEPLHLPKVIYEYFMLVFSNEKKEIEIDKIVGSHDYRNIENKTWLENMKRTCEKENIASYLENPKSIIKENHPFLLFETEGKYYIADGHHRLSTLLTHYQILKSKNLPLDILPLTIPALVRKIPKNIEFITRFVSFCAKNNLFYEDEEGIMPCFTLVDSNNGYPIIKFDGLEELIDEHTNLEELLIKIQGEKKQRSLS